jgi:hypothetical protein
VFKCFLLVILFIYYILTVFSNANVLVREKKLERGRREKKLSRERERRGWKRKRESISHNFIPSKSVFNETQETLK